MTCLLIFTIPNMVFIYLLYFNHFLFFLNLSIKNFIKAIRFSSFEFLRNHVFIENTKTNNFVSGLCAGFIEGTLV